MLIYPLDAAGLHVNLSVGFNGWDLMGELAEEVGDAEEVLVGEGGV